MIEIKCTEEQKEILAEILALSDKCFLGENVCEALDCGECIENIKWDILPEPLKPCPCCGGEAEFVPFVNKVAYVRCKSCHLQTITYESEAQAAQAWNRRTTS